MFNRKLLLLITVSFGVFQNVSSSPALFDFLKSTVKHIRCDVHKIANKLMSHEHKHHNPCEPHYSGGMGIAASSDGHTIQQISSYQKGHIKETHLTNSGFETGVETYTDEHIIPVNDLNGLKPRNPVVESTTAKVQERSETGKTWMFKEKCKEGEIATANGCKPLGSITAGMKPDQMRN